MTEDDQKLKTSTLVWHPTNNSNTVQTLLMVAPYTAIDYIWAEAQFRAAEIANHKSIQRSVCIPLINHVNKSSTCCFFSNYERHKQFDQ